MGEYTGCDIRVLFPDCAESLTTRRCITPDRETSVATNRSRRKETQRKQVLKAQLITQGVSLALGSPLLIANRLSCRGVYTRSHSNQRERFLVNICVFQRAFVCPTPSLIKVLASHFFNKLASI